MTKSDKLLQRFKSQPRDFTWSELRTLLCRLSFYELQGSGSRVKFLNTEADCLIQLHTPHPAKIIKPYVIKEILYLLSEADLI